MSIGNSATSLYDDCSQPCSTTPSTTTTTAITEASHETGSDTPFFVNSGVSRGNSTANTATRVSNSSNSRATMERGSFFDSSLHGTSQESPQFDSVFCFDRHGAMHHFTPQPSPRLAASQAPESRVGTPPPAPPSLPTINRSSVPSTLPMEHMKIVAESSAVAQRIDPEEGTTTSSLLQPTSNRGLAAVAEVSQHNNIDSELAWTANQSTEEQCDGLGTDDDDDGMPICLSVPPAHVQPRRLCSEKQLSCDTIRTQQASVQECGSAGIHGVDLQERREGTTTSESKTSTAVATSVMSGVIVVGGAVMLWHVFQHTRTYL